MTDPLPRGWTKATLSDIVEINPRHPRELNDSLPVSFATMAALSESRAEFQFRAERPLGEVRKGFTHFAEGDVLFAKITPCMENGKAAVAVGLRNGVGCGTTELHVLRPLGNVDPHYLYHFVHQQSFRRAAEANFTGSAGQARVPTRFMEETGIPLAPLNEQSRIAAKLELLLDKVDACQKRFAKIPILLKRFRQAVLAAACSGRLTADWREHKVTNDSGVELLADIARRRKEIWQLQRAAKGLSTKLTDYREPVPPTNEFELEFPDSWDVASIDKLTIAITSGSRDWTKYYCDDGPGTFVMAQNVRPMKFDRTYRLAVDPPQENQDRTRSEVKEDDILVTIVGANTGDVCRVPLKLLEHYVCQSVALMRPVVPETSPFIEIFLNSVGHGQQQYRKWIYGEGRPHLSFDQLRMTAIAVPPLAEQQEIVRRVEELCALADQIEARYAKAKQYVDSLKQSILAKAFRGELVPQDPNDEPATVLIERIREARGTKTMDRPKPRATKSGIAHQNPVL
jgi:type I restriction enzyme S subunit